MKTRKFWLIVIALTLLLAALACDDCIISDAGLICPSTDPPTAIPQTGGGWEPTATYGAEQFRLQQTALAKPPQ